MVFTTDEAETLRHAIDAVVSEVGPARDFEELVKRRGMERLRPEARSVGRWSPARVAVAAFLSVGLVGGAAFLLSSGEGDDGGALSFGAPGTDVTTSVGDAGSDPSPSTTATTVVSSTTVTTAPTTAAPLFDTQTFVGDGAIPPEAAAALRVDSRPVLEWGGAAGEPWALVTFEMAADPVGGKPAMKCITVLPLVGENYCATPGDTFNEVLYAIAYSIGDGGVVFVHATEGTAAVRVETAEGSEVFTVYGEADGYPPSAVIPTTSHWFQGSLTALDAAGEALGDPVEYSFDSDMFPETPLGG